MADWTITFKTRLNKNAVVTVGGFSESKTLIGSTEPLITAFDDDDDMFKFVRTQNGKLSFMGNYTHLIQLVDSNPMDHPVTLTIDGVTRWKGFVKTESYNQNLDSIDDVITLNLISQAEALFGIYVPITHETVTVGNLIKRMIDAVGGGITRILVSEKIDCEKIIPSNTFTDAWISVEIEQQADGTFYTSKTYGDLLDGVCALLGAQFYEDGTTWVFSHIDEDTSMKEILYENLGKDRQWAKDWSGSFVTSVIDRTTVNGSNLSYSDTDSKINIVRGKRSVTVSSSMKCNDDIFKLSIDPYKYKKKDSYIAFNGYMYEGGSTDELALENNDAFFKFIKGTAGVSEYGATYYNLAEYDETTGKHSFEKAVLMVSNQNVYMSTVREYPHINIASRHIVTSTTECYLHINVSGDYAESPTSQYSRTWWTDGGNFFYLHLFFIVKLGNKYLDINESGREAVWQDTKTWINGQYIGNLGKPNLYEEDASGMYIKLPSMTTAPLEISIYIQPTSGPSAKAVKIKDFNVEIIRSVSEDEHFGKNDEKKEMAFISNANDDDVSVSLPMSCSHDGINAINAIYDFWLEERYDEETEEDYTVEHFEEIHSVEYNGKTPEKSLVDRMAAHYNTSKMIATLDTLGLDDSKVGDLLTFENKSCAVISKETEWREENEKIKIHQI